MGGCKWMADICKEGGMIHTHAHMHTCGATESDAGGIQIAVKPASASSSSWLDSVLYQLCLCDSQLKPCAHNKKPPRG